MKLHDHLQTSEVLLTSQKYAKRTVNAHVKPIRRNESGEDDLALGVE
ncbi:hypothetical protein cypCar_00009871, partial [Cyprinus carpio]